MNTFLALADAITISYVLYIRKYIYIYIFFFFLSARLTDLLLSVLYVLTLEFSLELNSFFSHIFILLKITFNGKSSSSNILVTNSRFFLWNFGWENKTALSTKP